MPDTASDAVQAALEEALSDDKAESQSADESSTEVADVVKSAIGSDESASESETEESTEKDTKESDTVPKSRLSQVIRQRNELSEKFKNLEDQFKNASQTEKELRSRIGDLEQDRQILDAIKNLAQDEKYRDHVVAIDKALQGIEDEVDEAKAKGDQKAESQALKKLDEKTAEIENLLADQRAESLWNEAQNYAKSMLEALPEEFTEEDRVRIGKLWTPRVDWDKIESDGRESIPEALKSSFVAVIKEYGTPQGTLVAKTRKEVESRVPEAKIMSEEEKVKSILGTNWADKDKEGKAKYSDEEFNKAAAELLRVTSTG